MPGFFTMLPVELDRLDVGRLLAFRTGGDIKRNLLIFSQGLEAARLDSREVNKQIFALVIRGYKSKTFCIVEPFNGTSCHVNFLIKVDWAVAHVVRTKKETDGTETVLNLLACSCDRMIMESHLTPSIGTNAPSAM